MCSKLNIMPRIIGSLLLIFSLGASINASSQPFQYQWRIADLARVDAEVIEIGNKRGPVIQTLYTEQLRLLYAVKTAIDEAAELETELIIVDGNMPNAFAGIGERGEYIVGVNFAMLDLIGMDAHAAAALIGHETAHLKLAHGQQQQDAEMTTGILSVLGGAVLSGMGVPGGYALSNLTLAAIQSGYSRDNEREADYLGAIWAIEAGFEAEGGARLHEALNSIPGSSSASFFSTHPSGPERVASLRALAARLSRRH